ncbi:MAG: acyl-CoA thioesterase [Myxococcales bacterium]|nr:acyl-CoA thioesterase [Polyangiaceae bacterium]MDW8250233.1 acyl-CoA thioesterase [Myxococcales bacterium]
MTELTPRPPSRSVTSMTEYVLPTHANALGNVFGGQILAWMDICAAICAQRHCGTICVTAGIDDLAFDQPVKIGQVVRVTACVTAAFRSSIEIKVDVQGEDPASGHTWPCVSAFLTFVSLGPNGRPCAVPPLQVETEAERTLQAEASERRAHRLARKRPHQG